MRRIVAAFFVALMTTAAITVPGLAAAGASACARQPHDAVAQMCGDVDEKMYGLFATFIYPDVSYGPFAGTWPADFYNETQFFTDDAMTKSFAVGLDIHYTGTGSDYQPYWVDYTAGYDFHKIGTPAAASDHRNHTFTVLPTCENCPTWDIYYDFTKVGTTGAQPNPMSHHIMTGWDLTDIPGQVAFTATSNRVRYLTGNNIFAQFRRDAASFRAPDGDCSPGASALYCFHFDTAITTSGTTGDVASWDVTKRIVNPGAAAMTPTTPPQLTSGDDVDALLAQAQHLADTHRHQR